MPKDLSEKSLILVDASSDMQQFVKFLAIGRDPGLEEQLIKKSKQVHVLSNTPKDASERFSDQPALDTWLKKNRIVHWLVGADGDLAGVIWYGEKAFPKNIAISNAPSTTFAIRIYEGYVGKGLAVPFMRQSLGILAKSKQNLTNWRGIWLQTDINNAAAVASYTKFGYREVGRLRNKVVMSLKPSEIDKLISF